MRLEELGIIGRKSGNDSSERINASSLVDDACYFVNIK